MLRTQIHVYLTVDGYQLMITTHLFIYADVFPQFFIKIPQCSACYCHPMFVASHHVELILAGDGARVAGEVH